MHRQAPGLIVPVMLLVAAVGCSSQGTSPTFRMPTAPSPAPTAPPTAGPPPPAPGPPPVAGSLSGTVSVSTSAGIVLLDDVEVYCDSCGPFGHTFLYTDAEGFYRFPAVTAGQTPLLVRKVGYTVVGATRVFADGTGTLNVVVNGDTRFDIQLMPR